MRKLSILALALLVALAVGLAACGGEEETTTTAAPSTATTQAPETTTTSAAETTTTSAATQEPVTLKMASTFQETETGGLMAQHFIDLIQERTNGAVKIELYPGGTLGGPPEVLGLLESGAADIAPFGHPAAASSLPLLNFPMWAPGSQEDAIAYFNHLVFDNPDTAPLIQAEAESHNIKYLGFNAGGSNVFISKTPFTTLAELKGKKCAVGGMIPAFQAIGLEPVESFPPDTYENLSRGIADCTQMGFAPTVQLKWYEVAKYYMFDGTFAAGNPWTINLKAWAKLTPETQQVFLDVAKEMEEWSTQLTLSEEQKALETIKTAGVTVGTLSPEDQKLWWDALFKAGADSQYQLAKDGGFVDQMVTVLKAAAAFTGTSWEPPAE